MATVSPGFRGREERRRPSAELPPGQYLVQVLLRLVRGPGRAWLDLRGPTWLKLPVPEET